LARRKKPNDPMQRRVSRIEKILETYRLREAADSLLSNKRLVWRHFLAGVARGVGTFLGFSVLAALIGYILTTALVDNWPQFSAWLESALHNLNNRI